MAKEKIGALVPVEEQPYPVPENWRWVHLEACKDTEDSFFDGDWILSENMDPTGSVRLLQLSDIGIGSFLDKSDKHISEETFRKLGCTELHEGDLMISRMAEPIARSCIVPLFPYTVITAVDVAVIRCKCNTILNRYLNYVCNTKWFTDLAFSLARGTTRVRITRNHLGEMPVPLPPIQEQQRIVDRIESLFAKLDEAKEKAQAVVDGFEDRKAAILHQAFTGKLSRQFDTSWKEVKLKELVSDFKYGSSEKSNYTNNGMPVLRIPNIGDEGIVFSDMKYLAHNNVDADSQIHENDILIIRSNGSRDLVGKCAVVPSLDRAYAYASFLIRIKPSDMVNPIYLSMYLNSSDARSQMFAKEKSSAGINNINTKELGEIVLRLPCLSEQKRIVSFLTAQLNRVISCKKAAEKAVDLIEHLKKAILARAFRGELGTNDPSEPPADIGVS